MIRAIRKRFIRIAVGVLALAMVLVTLTVNAVNAINVRSELYETIGYISGNAAPSEKREGRARYMRNTLNESRYFTMVQRNGDEWTMKDTSRMESEDAQALASFAREALAGGRESGFSGDYLFAVKEDRLGKTAVFLNCETKLSRLRSLALISAAACAAFIALAWYLVSVFSSRAIRPLVENAVMQKQFITDAGHELKTPLTVISANMDVLALETGKNEWVDSTKKQVADMRALVDEMIYLSRLNEEEAKLERRELDMSALVRDAAEPFQAMAEYKGRTLAVEAGEGVRLTGDEGALRRLVSILCDNAVKYAPEGDTIALTLKKAGRGSVELACENAMSEPMDDETLRHLFDRFYRADASRSREKGGYGIGLSIARAVAERHGGSMTARRTKDGRIEFIALFKA